ncbi:MAG: Stk1 family PASTA domain-containing Ser/Thr kinase [Lachnospiraceae bacterium]|nr:Stk1 family PASTA domain-containing Ser/Thr kinase [Lachnospiraceae bacterium]
MVKIGMMIGERYEVLEKIGTGGMSDVYKAKDHKLNRFVAVKVLKQEFAENANFVSKFKIEAQAAAGLMHPNIVNVYDVGEENGTNYIVMELVEGITLKKYIEKKARLSVKEAVTIAIQIGMGIEAAHNNHIIHRDIKPQNVIISKEGKVKVTDFGIAKAATSNTITSNVMGSVHYTSPEQARGGYSDEKSDIYSLGITLFEMLTGRVPFNGETTVAIAIKQIQEEMPSPREYVDDIPISVEQIVLKCTQKSPDRRYQSMGALIEDLKKTFITPDEDFVKIKEDDEFGETRPVTPGELEALKKSTKGSDELTGELPKVNPNAKVDESEYDSKMDRLTTILAIFMGAAILVIAIFLISKGIGVLKLGKENTEKVPTSVSMEKPEQIVMPQVERKSEEDAKKILEKNGLKFFIKYTESDSVEKGYVISASVKEGLKVDKGSEIVLNVSSGSTSVIVPDVVGKALEGATKAIMDLNLKVEIKKDYSDTVPEGSIISQFPEGGEKTPENSTVLITVSQGVAENLVKVPNVLGKDNDDAVILLTEAGLKVNPVAPVYDNIFPDGQICYQSIEGDTEVPQGTAIDLHASMGPEPPDTVLYRFNSSINAPSTAEDPEFEMGTKVEIVVAAANGDVLQSTWTTSFPISVNISNISGANSGTITLTYEVKISAEKDASGNIITEEKKEKKVIKRDVNFELDE